MKETRSQVNQEFPFRKPLELEGPGYHRRNLDQWNAITLASVTAKNPDKSTYENVQLLINELRQLQYGLTPALQSTEFLHNKIVTACQGSPACRYAVSDPPSGLAQLINKLQSSITSYEKELDATAPDSFFTDRRYYRNRQQGRYQGRKYNNYYNPPRQRNQRDVCFVCRKEGCRSWKHTQQEQDDEKARFKSRNISRFNTRSPNFSRRFDESYRQYVADFEGDIDDLEDAFGALLVDDNGNESSKKEEPDGFSAPSFFTSVDTLLTDSTTDSTTSSTSITPFAVDIVNSLSNQSLLHQLTPRELPKPPDDELPNNVEESLTITTGASSRYDSHCFYGVVIDTGASKYSTAGYPQFQALQRLNYNLNLDKSTKGTVKVQFGIGTSLSIGSTIVETPIGQVQFHIMTSQTPFLLSLADMDKLSVYFNNLSNALITPNGLVFITRFL